MFDKKIDSIKIHVSCITKNYTFGYCFIFFKNYLYYIYYRINC